MKLCHLLPVLAAAAAIAGCGGGDGDDDASSPLDEALGHLPADTGFAFVASTETGDYEDIQTVLDKFPFGGRVEDALKEQLAQGSVDYEDDIEPLLGNDVVIGVMDNAAFTADEDDTPFVVALQAGDQDKLAELAEKDSEDRGEAEGYDIFQSTDEDDTWLAIKDDVVVISNTEETLKESLAQRGEDDRFTEDDFEAAFEDLSEDAPIKVYANIKALLAADPEAKEALKVKWVEHIETFGMTAEVTEDEARIEFALNTDEEGLAEGDVPLPTGGDTPQVFERDDDRAEIVVGLRNPAHIVDFGLAVAQVVDPAGFAQFETGKEAINKRLRINVDQDVLAQLTGDVSAAATIEGRFGVRAELEDPDAFEGTLAKVMEGLPKLSEDITVTEPAEGDRFYGLASATGESYAVGVADGALVIANDAALASDVATRELGDVEGLDGAFVATADAEQLVNRALARFAGGLEGLGGSLFTGPLGDVELSVSGSTDAVEGSLTLEIE